MDGLSCQCAGKMTWKREIFMTQWQTTVGADSFKRQEGVVFSAQRTGLGRTPRCSLQNKETMHCSQVWIDVFLGETRSRAIHHLRPQKRGGDRSRWRRKACNRLLTEAERDMEWVGRQHQGLA